MIENGRLTTENERLHGFFNRVQAEMVEYSEGLA